MRYGYFSEELYEKYLTGETLVDGRNILRLLTYRANNGNRVAEEYMALIELNNQKWKSKSCHQHHAVNTDAQT